MKKVRFSMMFCSSKEFYYSFGKSIFMLFLITAMAVFMSACKDSKEPEPEPEPEPDPTYTVSFTVYLTDGLTPAVNADVNLKGTNVDKTSPTDANGKVSFSELLAGAYTYSITFYDPVQQSDGSYTLSESSDKNVNVTLEALPQETQVRVQVMYDAENVAFRFAWKSMAKTMPVGFANVGKVYPGQFHDMLKHNGTKFDRLASGARMWEDRITFMIDKIDGPVAGFKNATCAMTCHTGMDSHNLGTPDVIDHWHWRGGRIGPAGYAEDAAVGEVERIRDNVGTPPSKFIRSGGDRLREDQVALTGTGLSVLENGLPRFVFNKGKKIGDYTIPNYFISNESGAVIKDPYTELPNITDLSINRSLLIVYQDMAFDPQNKVTGLDLGYLVYVATTSTDHLPAHLQDTDTDHFVFWRDFWATESGVAPTEVDKATNKLNEIDAEWVASDKMAMVTRSVGFIYESDQHDITSKRFFDVATGEWSVVLYRKLSTGSNRDVDLSGLPTGTQYAFSFAMHDVGGDAASHDISMPLILSSAVNEEVRAQMVSNVKAVAWANYPSYDTYYVKRDFHSKWRVEWLKSDSHFGSGSFETKSCVECHGAGTGKVAKELIYNSVLP